MHFCVMFVMRSDIQPKTTAAALLWKYNLQYQYIFIAQKMYVNFATTKLILLPGLVPGSKSVLPPEKMNF